MNFKINFPNGKIFIDYTSDSNGLYIGRVFHYKYKNFMPDYDEFYHEFDWKIIEMLEDRTEVWVEAYLQ